MIIDNVPLSKYIADRSAVIEAGVATSKGSKYNPKTPSENNADDDVITTG